MIGGLLKSSTSTVALCAAAGLFVGGVALSSSAKAADLGGDCCADLEERVAELEATTARKGTRQMSLTVSGQVARSILYWNTDVAGASGTSGVYAGLDNTIQSSRFTFSGTGRINANVKAGFEMMVEWTPGARTASVTQSDVDGAATGTTAGTVAGGEGGIAIRLANWYLEDKNLGKLTVGRLSFGGPVATIDLGGISTAFAASPSLVGGGFIVTGAFATGASLARLVGPSYGGDRIEGIRYDSPSIGGFVAQASWGEDDMWSASLRYAAEFSGFRVAAGIGYQSQDPVNVAGSYDSSAFNLARAEHEWAGSVAIMHVPSGLFAQGQYAKSEFFNGTDARIWHVQAGITKNWSGLGNTSLYGEYGNAQDFVKGGAASDLVGLPTASSDVTFWGLGIVQQIDSAAMELFLAYRKFDVEVTGAGVLNGASELDLVHGGARVRF